MRTWLQSNLGTMFITAALVFVVWWIIRSMIRDRRAGKSSCDGNCWHCKGCP